MLGKLHVGTPTPLSARSPQFSLLTHAPTHKTSALLDGNDRKSETYQQTGGGQVISLHPYRQTDHRMNPTDKHISVKLVCQLLKLTIQNLILTYQNHKIPRSNQSNPTNECSSENAHMIKQQNIRERNKTGYHPELNRASK